METIIKKIKLEKRFHDYFKDASLLNAVFDKNERVLTLKFKVDKTLPYEVFFSVLNHLQLYLKVSVHLEVEAEQNGLDHFNIMNYFDYFVNRHQLHKLKNVILNESGHNLTLLCNDEFEMIDIQQEIDRLSDLFCGVGIKRTLKTQLLQENKEEVIKTVVQRPEVEATQPRRSTPRPTRNNISYSDYSFVPLKHLNEDALNIQVEGEIFDVLITELRNGTGFAVRYYLHDGESAIIVNRIHRSEDEIINKGSFVRFYGDYRFDSRPFINGYIFDYKRFEMIDPLFERKDQADVKRIEFHLHTKISEMDAVSDIETYLKQAFEWGHPGLVITDHEGVQSFPKAHNAYKKLKSKYPDHDFKVGYGVEMNLADEFLTIVSRPRGQKIQSASYVVFDIETTGLSAYDDHMIEFGAVKIVDGQTIDSIQMFIKPPISIPPFITSLTSISDEVVKDAATIDILMPKILEFFGDAILVAHNATFDIDFIQETLRRLDLPPLTNTVIDTLDLSRALFENRRSYRLGSIARLLKIAYDDDVAHRADYDAEILSNVFFQMKRTPKVLELDTVDQLQTLSLDTGFAKTRKSHLSVIAKNQAGLKSLYELVSLSYTDYLASFGGASKNSEYLAEPRIIKRELDSRRENLLIGAGCINSDVFEFAMNKSDAQLDAVVSFYDFVEIMPLIVYQPLFDRRTLNSKQQLIRVIQRIIDSAKRLDKIVIATGDVHYNHPNEKVVRDVYIHSQGIGGVRHPLYIFDETRRINAISPDQHFRSTDEMLASFPYLSNEDVHKYVVENPRKLLESMEYIEPIKKDLFTPKLDNSDELLKDIVYKNATRIYGNPLPLIVEDRLKGELNSIIGHGFGVIYYISHLLVKKSLNDGYLVGSRGSVGSSLVATMAEITEVNPLPAHYVCMKCNASEFFTEGQYSSGFDLNPKMCPHCGEHMHQDGQDIPFETFLGFEGDKVPDIDLNFSGVYQEIAHAYTKELFGEAYVYRAGTISTVAQKTAFGYVQGYYESINENVSNQAWKSYLALGAEGVKRTTGQHPGGIIVIPNYMDVHDFTPVQFPANNPNSAWKTTHFEFHDIHDNVLKLDILGHVDPTAMKMLERLSGVDIHTVPMNDPKTISLFSSPDALEVDRRTYHEKTGGLGIPEFGTPFVRKMLEATRPDTFSDLVRISGLSHGTDVWRNNAQELIEKGLTLKDVIGCRDDIMVYLMHHGLKPKLAFDIMESVRKGRGLREEWIKEMKEHSIPSWYIDSCQKIKYMFPKAHAVAYVMMAIRVAWFKVYHPLTYYAVYFTLRVNAYEIETMTSSLDVVSKRLNNIQTRLQNVETKRDVSSKEVSLVDTLEVTIEMLSRGYQMSAISLYDSHATEFILDPKNDKAILPPFNVIDGLGDSVARSIVEAREEQTFISKQDLMNRTALSTTLVKKLDDLGVTSSLQESNQMSLFG